MLLPIALALSLSGSPSYIEETQALLNQVEQQMRDQTAHHALSDDARDKRLGLLDELRGYADAGLFPHNHTQPTSVPVFIDEHNTHCAVAYMMLASGHDDLARALAAEDNHLRLPSNDARVTRWAAEHGFTVDELSRIQRPGYRPQPREKQISRRAKDSDKRLVTRALDSAWDALSRCRQAEGGATISFWVLTGGRTAGIKLHGASPTPAQQRCVKSVVRQLNLSKFKGDKQRMRYPLPPSRA